MKIKDMAVLGTASGILIQAWAAPLSAADRISPNGDFQMLIELAGASELAGADDPDRAAPSQLKKAGQPMIPAEGMKKAEPQSQPSMQNTAAPMTKADDADKMPAKAAPAAETKPAAADKPAMQEKSMRDARAGHYLRADVGYAFGIDPDGTTSAGAMTAEDVGNAIAFDGGVGYRFDKNLRSDLTFGYRNDADVAATTAGGTAVTSDVGGWTVMVNGYWDFDGMKGITPYVGAGLGFARLETSTQSGGNGEAGATTNNFAWAAMLGLAIDLGTSGAVVDLGYRFINLGGFEQASGGAEYDELMAHEIRAGLRYAF
jgi:opacity protein-like surface antigen